jgi:hypothetical protein
MRQRDHQRYPALAEKSRYPHQADGKTELSAAAPAISNDTRPIAQKFETVGPVLILCTEVDGAARRRHCQPRNAALAVLPEASHSLMISKMIVVA